ncbi:FAM172 family protein homolog CG10038 [Cryptotermes secundus]|uniref:FAM172 family protein homolog CG10038 n=1 Tax=Cryptotermes secundus TaxID=105785 RepID=UPI001454D757|nr:FAM172 family protein homolog CG10038 [Cryptotermes secundus]
MVTLLKIEFGVRVIFLLVMISAEGEWSFPDTLEGFGYAFNKDGQLRKIDPNTGGPGSESFEFNVSENEDYNQKRYEALGDVSVTTENTRCIFSLLINDSLQSGSQIPFIKRARELGYAIIVMNPNENTKVVGGKIIKIKNSQNAKEHAHYIWKHYVKEMTPKHIAIIAHSYGGFLTVDLATQYYSDFHSRVFAIALTDSVHSLEMQKVPPRVSEYLQKVSRNWASHDTPLDTPLPSKMAGDIPRVSAGHTRHEMTSWSSFESVFTFLQERYSALSNKEEL